MKDGKVGGCMVSGEAWGWRGLRTVLNRIRRMYLSLLAFLCMLMDDGRGRGGKKRYCGLKREKEVRREVLRSLKRRSNWMRGGKGLIMTLWKCRIQTWALEEARRRLEAEGILGAEDGRTTE